MIVATGHAEPVPDPQEPDPDLVQDEREPIMATESTPGPQPPAPQPESPQYFAIEPISELSQILLENQELNAAMDEVVARLGSHRISATALRTYRRLVDALPPTVQRALTPITQLVEAQP